MQLEDLFVRISCNVITALSRRVLEQLIPRGVGYKAETRGARPRASGDGWV